MNNINPEAELRGILLIKPVFLLHLSKEIVESYNHFLLEIGY